MARIRAAGIALAMIVSVAGGSAAFGDDGADSGTAVSPSQAAGQSVSDARDSGATPAGAAEVKAGEGEPTGGDATPQASEGDAAEAGMPAAEAGESSEETVVPEENGEDAVSTDEPAAEAGDSPVTGFSDVPVSHAQYSSIMWLAGKGITSGWEDGTFKPDSIVSREAMAAFLYRYAGVPEYQPPASSPFTDVPTSHRFYREISWASASGLTTGYSDGTFRPADTVSRGAVAAFLWRLAGTPSAGAENPFVDLGVCHPQRRAILWLAGAGLAQGYGDHTFRPSAGLSRAAFAAFLHRYDAKGMGAKASPASPAREPAAPAAGSFRDVPASSRFAGDISWLSSTGITTGYADGTFKPHGAVTRDAFVAFLYRFAGSPAYTPPSKSPFKDVATSHPFYREIAWASASGIAGGYSDGTFRPAQAVTRAATAAFLFRAAGNPASPRGGGFPDTKCSEHRTAISWLAAAGITTGYGGGKFQPGLPVERQAMAAFLHRMCAKGLGVVASPWSKATAYKDGIPSECIPKAKPAAAAAPAVASMATVLAGINDPQAREMAQKAQGYSSPSKWLILANQNTARVGIFEKRQGRWFLTRYWASGPGAPSTPTRRGVFSVGNRGHSFGSGFTAYYWTQFSGDFLFHSILYYQNTLRVKDGTLGRKVSHGCVRLAIENAKWIHDNIPRGTTVVSY